MQAGIKVTRTGTTGPASVGAIKARRNEGDEAMDKDFGDRDRNTAGTENIDDALDDADRQADAGAPTYDDVSGTPTPGHSAATAPPGPAEHTGAMRDTEASSPDAAGRGDTAGRGDSAGRSDTAGRDDTAGRGADTEKGEQDGDDWADKAQDAAEGLIDKAKGWFGGHKK